MIVSPVPPSGQIEGNRHRIAVRVYHEDTDASGVVYHGSYLRWFERSRSDILSLIGIDQRHAMDSGKGFYVVSDMSLRYRAPARLGDAVVIETVCEETRAASARMTQIALRDGEVLCEATVRVGFVGPGGRPERQPEEWRRAFASIVPHKERV